MRRGSGDLEHAGSPALAGAQAQAERGPSSQPHGAALARGAVPCASPCISRCCTHCVPWLHHSIFPHPGSGRCPAPQRTPGRSLQGREGAPGMRVKPWQARHVHGAGAGQVRPQRSHPSIPLTGDEQANVVAGRRNLLGGCAGHLVAAGIGVLCELWGGVKGSVLVHSCGGRQLQQARAVGVLPCPAGTVKDGAFSASTPDSQTRRLCQWQARWRATGP